MNDEIALFIDFENIRYSLLNVRHREPDPQELIGVARRFGTVMVARAYADWTRQPDFFKGSLTAAMIDRVDCPAKVRDRYRSMGPAPYPAAPYPAGPYPTYGSYGPGLRQYEPGPEDGGDDQMLDEQGGEDLGEEAGEAADPAAEAAPEVSGEEGAEADEADRGDEGEEGDEGYEAEEANPDDLPAHRYEPINHRSYGPPPGYGPPQSYHAGPPHGFSQSSVDLNMLMDIIETVFDRPSIGTYVLMTGDRDFTRICARLKLRLNKRVIIVGVPGTVSRDLIAAASQFIPLGGAPGFGRGPMRQDYLPQGPVEPEEPGFIQFLDYIDTHWAWRTVGGVANFIGDAYNPKNRFRGRLTRDSARELLHECIDRGILVVVPDPAGGESLRLNRQHPAVESILSGEAAPQQ